MTKLESSEARNSAALAISSDVPMRPMGTLETIRAMASGGAPLAKGVSVGPGLKTFERIPRSFNSTVQAHTKLRIAALVAPYTQNPGVPLMLPTEPVRMIEAPSFNSGSAFCTVKSVPFTLVSKSLS